MAIKNGLMTIAVATVYLLFFEKFADVSFKGQPRCQRNSNRFVLLFVCGIFGLVASRKYFDHRNPNPVLKNGISLGGLLMALKITVSYWSQMNDQMKLAVIGFLFGGLFLHNYLRRDSKPQETNDQKVEKSSEVRDKSNVRHQNRR